MRYRLLILVASVASLCIGAGCVDKKEAQESEEIAPASEGKPGEVTLSSGDAAPARPPQPLPEAPLTGTHLDSASSTYQPSGYQPRVNLPRKAKDKDIELVLRSTPPGAIASIDGKAIGSTPTFWQGPADGQAHEYTFTKKGYAMARYRFVATQSGVVHGSLDALVISNEASATRASDAAE